MIEYQGAERMSALQNFVSDLEGGGKTCADILSDAKHFIICFRKRNVLYVVLCYTLVGPSLLLRQERRYQFFLIIFYLLF